MTSWFQVDISMLRVLFATVLAFSTINLYAAEAIADEAVSVVDMSEPALDVTISAIPTLPPVIEILKFDGPVTSMRATKKLRQAKKALSPNLMLTRTERRQVALLVASSKGNELQGRTYDSDDNNQTGLDDLDLHRSFSRPKVVDEPDQDKANADELPGRIRLRLMFARLKAVEAHALNQVQDSDEALPDAVLLRLKEARLKAVQAHQEKFGPQAA